MSTDEKTFSQADLDRIIAERLGQAKVKTDAQLAELKTQLADVKAKLAEAEPRAARAAELERELAETKEAGARDEAFRAVGIEGEAAASLRDRLTTYHRAISPTGEDGQPIPFATWLREHAAADELVGVHLKPAAGAGAPAGAPGTPGKDTPNGTSAPGGPPKPGAPARPPGGQAPPPPGARLTPEQYKARHAALIREGKAKEAGEVLREALAASSSAPRA